VGRRWQKITNLSRGDGLPRRPAGYLRDEKGRREKGEVRDSGVQGGNSVKKREFLKRRGDGRTKKEKEKNAQTPVFKEKRK